MPNVGLDRRRQRIQRFDMVQSSKSTVAVGRPSMLLGAKPVIDHVISPHELTEAECQCCVLDHAGYFPPLSQLVQLRRRVPPDLHKI